MIRKGCLLVCLVVLFCTEISDQLCSYERLQQQNKDNLNFLQSKMNTAINLHCMSDGIEFSSSEDIRRKIDMSLEENVKVTIEEILRQISQIFRENYTESGWDENSLALFQQGLNQQMQVLKRCWNTERQMGTISPRQELLQLTRMSVEASFRRIQDFMRKEKYSRCAWENVYIEVQLYFLLINELTKKIQS